MKCTRSRKDVSIVRAVAARWLSDCTVVDLKTRRDPKNAHIFAARAVTRVAEGEVVRDMIIDLSCRPVLVVECRFETWPPPIRKRRNDASG